MLITILVILGIWGILTIWTEMPGPAKSWQYGNTNNIKKVLIVYDPDPIYNLDEQLCRAFGQAMSEHHIQATVATVKAMKELPTTGYDIYMLCANTYNWRPDMAITGFVKKHPELKGKPVAALTIGSGSTKESKAAFDRLLKEKGTDLVDSRTLWLMRPNDESRVKEPNVQVAISMTQQWAEELAKKLQPM